MATLSFDDVLKKSPKTDIEAILCQAIACLSTQTDFSHLDPWQVFDQVQKMSGHVGDPEWAPTARYKEYIVGDPEDEGQTSEQPDEEVLEPEPASTPEVTPADPLDGEMAHLSSQDFVDAFEALGERAKEVGLRPVQILGSMYLRRAMDAVNGFMDGLEGKRKE